MKKGKTNWARTRADLAKALGCHPISISRWSTENRDWPAHDTLRGADGRWNVDAWKQLIDERGLNTASDLEQDAGSQSLAELKRLKAVEELAILRIKKEVEGANYIERKEAGRILMECNERVKLLCRQIFEDELPPIVAGMNAGAVRSEARKANDRLCVLMAQYVKQLE